MAYHPRIVDGELAVRLHSAGAVLIEGVKACGKTSTGLQVAKSILRVDRDPRVPDLLAADPALLLEGGTPRLIDEWQEQPELWNHVRHEVDERQGSGQFILTGSATPEDDASRHSGAGRFARITMRPMSLYESGESTGEVSLAALMRGEEGRAAVPELRLEAVARTIVRGGWPGSIDLDDDSAALAVRDYLATIFNVDVPRVAGGRRDPERVSRLARSLARHTATEASLSTVIADTSSDGETLAWQTVDDYLDVLRRAMVVEDQPAWSTHLRSAATLRGAPKRHFVDPSLAAAAVRASSGTLARDPAALGQLFESLVVRDLRIYSQALDGAVFHYRDSYGLEVDAIIEAFDGRWAAIEVKLGPGAVDGAASSLLKFRSTVDTSKRGEPAFLAVVVPSGFGYLRSDGVRVVPLTALGP